MSRIKEKSSVENYTYRKKKHAKDFLSGYHSGHWTRKVFPILNIPGHYWCHHTQQNFEILVMFLDELESISICINFSKNNRVELSTG